MVFYYAVVSTCFFINNKSTKCFPSGVAVQRLLFAQQLGGILDEMLLVFNGSLNKD
jgi:hypothetical protein